MLYLDRAGCCISAYVASNKVTLCGHAEQKIMLIYCICNLSISF